MTSRRPGSSSRDLCHRLIRSASFGGGHPTAPAFIGRGNDNRVEFPSERPSAATHEGIGGPTAMGCKPTAIAFFRGRPLVGLGPIVGTKPFAYGLSHKL